MVDNVEALRLEDEEGFSWLVNNKDGTATYIDAAGNTYRVSGESIEVVQHYSNAILDVPPLDFP